MTRRNVKKHHRKKQKLNIFRFSTMMMSVFGILFLISSLTFKSINNGLSTQIQEITNQITTLETANDAIQVDIQTLANRERVNTIAGSDGMKSESDNVITISQADSQGD